MSALHRASRNATEPQAILEMPRIAAYNRSSGLLLFFTRMLAFLAFLRSNLVLLEQSADAYDDAGCTFDSYSAGDAVTTTTTRHVTPLADDDEDDADDQDDEKEEKDADAAVEASRNNGFVMPTDQRDPNTVTYGVLATPEWIGAADKLIADSVSEMQFHFGRRLFSAPRTVLPLMAVLAFLTRYFDSSTPFTHPAKLTACITIVVYLCFIVILSWKYNLYTEIIMQSWFDDDAEDKDLFLGAAVNGKLIGVCMLRISPKDSGSSSSKQRKGRPSGFRGGSGTICGWLVKPSHRHHGVGREMLRNCLILTREFCGKDATIAFALQHLHSPLVLPDSMTRMLKREELRSLKTLQNVTEAENDRRRRDKKKQKKK